MAVAPVSLEYQEPDISLRSHVSLFYEFKADLPSFEDDERADLAQLRFLIRGRHPTYRFVDGYSCSSPHIQLLGPTTGVTRTGALGPILVFGCGLLSPSWGDLIHRDASTVCNRVLDATTVFGPAIAALMQTLSDAPTFAARVTLLEAFLTTLLGAGRRPGAGFTHHVDAWLAESGSPDVAALVRRCGTSRRQVERDCRRHYGSPPKLLARKYRALRAAVAIVRGEADQASLIDRYFYDQPHFIREIKQFTGVTPKRLTTDLPTLAHLTMQRTDFADLSPLITRT